MNITAQEHLATKGLCCDGPAVKIWLASYSAAMVRQIFDYMHEGRGSPDNDVVAGFREEAEEVADMILGVE